MGLHARVISYILLYSIPGRVKCPYFRWVVRGGREKEKECRVHGPVDLCVLIQKKVVMLCGLGENSFSFILIHSCLFCVCETLPSNCPNYLSRLRFFIVL